MKQCVLRGTGDLRLFGRNLSMKKLGGLRERAAWQQKKSELYTLLLPKLCGWMSPWFGTDTDTTTKQGRKKTSRPAAIPQLVFVGV